MGEVLKCLEDHGFRLKKSKCTFLAKSVEYLGHQIDQHGIRAVPSKIEAISHALEPTNVQELAPIISGITELLRQIHPKSVKYPPPTQSATQR